jgi:hypothetical protein
LPSLKTLSIHMMAKSGLIPQPRQSSMPWFKPQSKKPPTFPDLFRQLLETRLGKTSENQQTNMSTGDTIGADIAAAAPIIAAIVGVAYAGNPVIVNGVTLAMNLLAKAEPAIYNAVAAAAQGTALTTEQKQQMSDAISRLQNPGQYFA